MDVKQILESPELMGSGGWHRCLSSKEFCNGNPLVGREEIPPGILEWFVVKEPA